jgi:hypothetical protein
VRPCERRKVRAYGSEEWEEWYRGQIRKEEDEADGKFGEGTKYFRNCFFPSEDFEGSNDFRKG